MAKKDKPAKVTRKKTPDSAVTVVLTGFDAFAGAKYNPSQLVVESFPDILKGKARGQSKSAKEIHIRKQILPTSGAKGWKVLLKTLDDAVKAAEGQVHVVMVGLAATRRTIGLERFAMNFRDYKVADNNNEKRHEETIEPKAPQLLRTSHNLPKLETILNEAGYPCIISNHAGTFVCNEMYFRALNYKRESPHIDSVIFVHIPDEKEYAKTAKKAKDKDTPKAVAAKLKGLAKANQNKQIDFINDVVVEIIENIAQENIVYPGLRKARVTKK